MCSPDPQADALRRSFLCALVALELEVSPTYLHRARSRCLRMSRDAERRLAPEAASAWLRAAAILADDLARLTPARGV